MQTPSRRALSGFLAAVTILSAACICTLNSAPDSAAPAPQNTQPAAGAPAAEEAASAPTFALAFDVVGDTPQPAIPEQRLLTLEFPPQIRAGDSEIVRLTLEVDRLGNVTPTAQVQGNEVRGETVEIPNLYETHLVTAEARLDLAGAEVRPPDIISEPLEPGQSVTFFWSVRPPETGRFQGTVWLHLRFVDKSSGEERRAPVSAQSIEIESVDLFGMSANLARATGAVGSLVGAVLGFPFMADILKFLFRRFKK